MKIFGLLVLCLVGLSGLRLGNNSPSDASSAAHAYSPQFSNYVNSLDYKPSLPVFDWFKAALSGDSGMLVLLHAEFPQLLDIPNRNGHTALHLAQSKGHCEAINTLLTLGAVPSIPFVEQRVHEYAFPGTAYKIIEYFKRSDEKCSSKKIKKKR